MSTTTATPEMPIDGQRFPLQRRKRAPLAYHPQESPQQQLAKQRVMLVPGKFPLQQAVETAYRFPLQQQQQLPNVNRRPITLRFPLAVNHLSVRQRFPTTMCQLPKKNFNYSIKTTRDCGWRSPLVMSRTPKEFPTIKKPFVSFPNNQQQQQQPPQQTCKSLTANADAVGVGVADANTGYGNCQENKTRTDVEENVNMCVFPTPATMTQMSHNPSTKIDMDDSSTRTVETANDDVNVDVVSFDVHKATCDNELNAHEQTLNLNVVEAAQAEGVGEQKEIEHQQAENFNDAFGRRHHNENDNDDNNNDNHNKDDGKAGEGEGNDDAMNAISAKNKHEICEQSKLETTAATHNELNMTKEQQSICLASERARQNQTIAETATATAATAEATAASNNRSSDARGSSSEQVDGQQRQEINVVKSNAPTIVTQNDTRAASLSPSPSPSPLSSLLSSSSSSEHPSIEFFKCAVRELFEEGASRVSPIDLDLFDLLSELVQLLDTPTAPNTGLLWSEPLLEQVVSECVDMTVSKVSEDSETTTTAAVVDIYSEQLDQQPLELDDNNNSNSSNQNDMKYESLRSNSRLPESLSSSRLSSSAANTASVTPTAAATSRIRDTTNSVSPATSRIRDTATSVSPATCRIRDTASTATSRLRDATAPATSTTTSRLRDTTTPITSASTSRLRDTTVPATPATTSRIRDVPTTGTTRPLLSELNRSSSSRDVSLEADSVLPERTRLRRQRRMRSQDSVEEKPEDVVERINKLKARISASLSEVKSVIKQYSTESEAEAAGEKWLGPPTTSTAAVPKVETDPVATQPVQFRFVKKVRRRSYFDEAEEEKEQAKESEKDEKTKASELQLETEKKTATQIDETKQTKVNENKTEEQQDKLIAPSELSKIQEEQLQKQPTEAVPTEAEKKEEENNLSEAAESKLSVDKEEQKKTQEAIQEKETNRIEAKHASKSESKKQQAPKQVDSKEKIKDEKKQKTPKDAEEKKLKSTEATQSINTQGEQKPPTVIKENQTHKHEEQLPKPIMNGELPKEMSKEKDKVQSKIEFLAKVQSELKAKPKAKELTTIKEQPQEAAVEAAAEATATTTSATTEATTVTKAPTATETTAATVTSTSTAVKATSSATAATTAAVPPTATAAATSATTKQPVEAVEATPQTAALPKESATQPANLEDKQVASTRTEATAAAATKKKTIVKVKNPRRASIAAVEQSKIVPEAVQSDVLTQRRPSDSEAIVKRKKKQKLTSIVADATTSGSSNQTVAAATPKTSQLQQQTATTAAINEQLVAVKVESHESTAKRVTKPTAKSVEGDEQKTSAAITAQAAATAAEATAPVATTAAAATTASEPTAALAAATTKATTIAAEATTATSTATNEATATTTKTINEATAAAATVVTATAAETAPKQLPIDVIANKAPASGSSRRASLKLAELVGETVLVVPASATTQDLSTSATTTSETAATAVASATTENQAVICQSKEPINQSVIIIPATATPKQVVAGSGDIEVAPVVDVVVDVVVSTTPQIAATLSEVPHDESSPQKHQHDQNKTEQQQTEQQQQDQEQSQQLVEATKDNAADQIDNSLVAMPELKVLAGPRQPVKIETVEQPHDESDLSVAKKKSPHLKKLVRKSSIDKGKEKVTSEPNKLSNILKDKNKITNLADRLNKVTPPKKQTKAKEQSAVAENTEQQENAEFPELQTEAATEVEGEAEPEPEPEPIVEPAPKPKKPRQIKKKVIIKRQKRRLSIGDTFFIQQEPEEPKVPEIETIEKAIAYVTDDEDDEDLEPLPQQEPAKPLKSCLHVREYKIGDLILYAERYRKTQVRWKRGRVLERITSISYKLEIEGKEVPAHISYIKKYTGRKVKFVGKEYLDIDYEQVVEEERRARSYSIWNMV